MSQTIQASVYTPTPSPKQANVQIQGSSFRKGLPLKKKQAHFELLVFAFLVLNSSSWTNKNSKTLAVKNNCLAIDLLEVLMRNQ